MIFFLVWYGWAVGVFSGLIIGKLWYGSKLQDSYKEKLGSLEDPHAALRENDLR